MTKTTVVNLRYDDYDVYIGRGSKWGNPIPAGYTEEERTVALAAYEVYFWKSGLIEDISELFGKRLGCYCRPRRCHGDFLAKTANEYMRRSKQNERERSGGS